MDEMPCGLVILLPIDACPKFWLHSYFWLPQNLPNDEHNFLHPTLCRRYALRFFLSSFSDFFLHRFTFDPENEDSSFLLNVVTSILDRQRIIPYKIKIHIHFLEYLNTFQFFFNLSSERHKTCPVRWINVSGTERSSKGPDECITNSD